MLTKAQIKRIKELDDRKIRRESGLFLVEGDKLVREALQQQVFKVQQVYALREWLTEHTTLISEYPADAVSDGELKQLSRLNTPNKALAVLQINETDLDVKQLKGKLSIGLDCIQDPGNLGTIIRIADWFGIDHIVCSKDTVDVYNPKVVQSTMGSLFRVGVYYRELSSFIDVYKSELKQPVYGAMLEGENVYSKQLSTSGLLVMGNESKGLSADLRNLISDPILIPQMREGAESLNVAVATGILCALFKV